MDQNKKTVSQELDRLEQKYAVTFPPALRELYLRETAAPFRPFTFFVGGYECGVAKLIPPVADGLSFETIVDGDRADGFLPQSYFPLARDRGGNLYYWDSRTGKVFFVLNDDIEDPFLVFPTVSDFVRCVDEHQ